MGSAAVQHAGLITGGNLANLVALRLAGLDNCPGGGWGVGVFYFPFKTQPLKKPPSLEPSSGIHLDSSRPSHLREKNVDPSDADEPAELPPTSQTSVFDVSLSSLSMLMENEHVNKQEPGSSLKLLEWKLDLADGSHNSLKLEN